MQQRHAGDERIVRHTEQHARKPAVLARHGRQPVGKAQPDDDRLGIDRHGELRAGQSADKFRHKARRDVAQHDREHVQRVAALEAAADHAEHAAQRRCVPRRAHGAVVEHDEHAVYAEVQNACRGRELAAKVGVIARAAQELGIVAPAAEQQPAEDGKPEHHAAEQEADQLKAVGKTHALRRGRRGRKDLVQQRPQEKRRQPDGHCRVIQIVALVHFGAVRQHGGEEETDDHAHRQRQRKAERRKAVPALARVAEKHLRDERGKPGGEQKGVRHRAGRFFLDGAEQQHAREREPDVQDRRAPEAEARRQEKCQHAHAVGLCARQAVDAEADGAHERDVQECARDAAVARVKIALDGLPGLRADAPDAGKQLALSARRRDDRCQQAQDGKRAEQQPDGRRRLFEFFFHNSLPFG